MCCLLNPLSINSKQLLSFVQYLTPPSKIPTPSATPSLQQSGATVYRCSTTVHRCCSTAVHPGNSSNQSYEICYRNG
ncbi:hypothetical protein RIF29_38290 [Crotalaria pallida]|uniref:Uncharacterized protein n=1 Tax=Crotalaria pallida TaxID=3830 RepID=A0AAN9E1G3_CROPI